MYIFTGKHCFEEETIHTPVNHQRLSECLKGYHDAQHILNGFEQGFSLGLQRNPSLQPYTKIMPVKAALKEKLLDEVKKGRIIGPFETAPVKDLMISPICVIPKSDGNKYRMIFNLSHPKDQSVNDNIPETQTAVTYCSVTDVARWIVRQQGTWFMAKADLSDAYRMVPIKKSDWKYLGMRLGNSFFIDRCLPMGAASSCAIFQRISNGLAWMAMSASPAHCMVFNYLDDFLFLARSHIDCEISLKSFTNNCNEIGIPISTDKTILPTTSLIFLGIGIDSTKKELFIPQKKAESVLENLTKFLSKRTQRVKSWQSILGKLCHLSQVVSPGRAYLSSVYASLKGILSHHGDCYRTISAEAREDLEVWKSFLEEIPPTRHFRMLTPSAPTMVIYTDASQTVGFGAVWGQEWFAGEWPQDWKTLNIAVLEIFPILAALHTWEKKTENGNILIHTDNEAVVSVVNKLYAKDKGLRQLVKPLAIHCLTKNIKLQATHIKGTNNTGPDLLSRGKIKEFLTQFRHMRSTPAVMPENILPENLKLPA